MELGEVEFQPLVAHGSVPEAILKLSVEDNAETSFFTKPLLPGHKNQVHQSFEFIVYPPASSLDDEGGERGGASLELLQHFHQPHVRIDLFSLEANPEEDGDAEELAFRVVALSKEQRDLSSPSPKKLQQLALKDLEGRNVGSVTFKVTPVDGTSAPSSVGSAGSRPGSASLSAGLPASPTTAEIKFIEGEIAAVRYEFSQHRVQHEARVRTLKSRLENVMEFEAPFSDSQSTNEAVVHLQAFHEELMHLERELGADYFERVEKAERQTQEVLQLLEESNAEMTRLRAAAERHKRHLAAATERVEEISMERDLALRQKQDLECREPEVQLQALRGEMRNVLRAREEDKHAQEQRLASAAKLLSEKEEQFLEAQSQLAQKETHRGALEGQVLELRQQSRAREAQFNERLRRMSADAADAAGAAGEKDGQIANLEQQLLSVRSECEAAAKKNAADSKAHRLELVALQQKHADALANLRASGEKSGVEQLEQLRARIEAELGVQLEQERGSGAAKQQQLDALAEQLAASGQENKDLLERIDMLEATLKERAESAARDASRNAEDAAAQQEELKSGFEQDMSALRQRLHDALDRHSDSRAAADALRATGEALRVKLEASEASCLEKEQQLRAALEAAETHRAALRDHAFRARTEEANRAQERSELAAAAEALTAEVSARKAEAQELRASAREQAERMRELEAKVSDDSMGKVLAELAQAEDQMEHLKRDHEKKALETEGEMNDLRMRYDKSERDAKRLKEALGLAEAIAGGDFLSMANQYNEGKHPLATAEKPPMRLLWIVTFAVLTLVAFMAGKASVSGDKPQYITSLKHGYLSKIDDLEKNHTALVTSLQRERTALLERLADKQAGSCEADPYFVDQSKTLAAQLDTMTVDTIAHRARAERYFAAEQAAKAQLAAAEHQLQHATQIEGGPRRLIEAGTNLDSKSYLVNPCHAQQSVSPKACPVRYLQVFADGEVVITANLPSKSLPRSDQQVVWSSGKVVRRGDRWPLFRKKRENKKVDENHYELRLRRNGQLVVMDTETHRTLWRSTRDELPLAAYTASLNKGGQLIVTHPDGNISWKSHNETAGELLVADAGAGVVGTAVGLGEGAGQAAGRM
jgi:hypothetical protein